MKLLPTLFTLLWLTTQLPAETRQAVEDFWFNGAEINRYALDQNRYGAQHPGHVEFIFVTEPFLLEQQVKHESGPGESTPVLKLNALRTFNTGIYSYRTMTSTFLPTNQAKYPHALKSNTSIQDWCGQAYQQFNRTPEGWRFELRSYFQNEADQNLQLPDAILEDALWIQVRLDPKKLPSGTFQAIPGSVYTRFAHKPVTAYKAMGQLEKVGSTFTYTLVYPDLKRTLQIVFEPQFPHIIQEWQEITPNGRTTATLENRIMNSYYWDEHFPKDAPKRKQLLGLEPSAN